MLKKRHLSFFFLFALVLLFIVSSKVLGQELPAAVKESGKFIFYGRSSQKIEILNGKVTNLLQKPTGKAAGTNRIIIPVVKKGQSPAAVISLSVTTIQPSCGDYNGTIIISASGGVAPYTYQETNSLLQNTGNFPERNEGVYDFTVTDANGNIGTVQVTLANTLPSLHLNLASYTNATDCNKADATATLQASGGVPPYEYSMDGVNYQASNFFSGFYPGSYVFYVRDANGCVARYHDHVFNFFQPGNCGGFGFTVSQLFCGNVGSIRLSGYFGVSPYTYSMDGINFTAVNEFNNLPPGNHLVWYKDAVGKVIAFMIALEERCYINIDYITVDAACQQSDGILTVTASNGVGPYTYTIDGINYQTSNVFTGLTPGIYYITARDATGKTSSLGAQVFDRCPIIGLVATGETCAKNDGTITASATKGTAPYQYSTDGINFQTSNVFTGLAKGLYTVTLKDANGFTSADDVSVNDDCISVSTIIIPSTCGNSNGQVTVFVTKGQAPYQYSLDGINFQTSNIFTNILAANYTVTVKDANGLTGTAIIEVTSTPDPQVHLTTTPVSCTGADGKITASGTGGKIPYEYSLDGITYQVGNFFTGLTNRNYTVWIRDANQCITSGNILVTLSCPTVTAVAVNETCNSSNGTITASGSNGTVPYQYSIDGINYQAGNVFSNIKAGNYTVTIKDAATITNTTTVTVQNICPVVTAVAADGLCGTANGKITATGTNGTAPYQYAIDGISFQNSAVFTNLTSAEYTVTIRDANNITSTTKVMVKNYPGPAVNAVSTNTTCINNNGSVTMTATGGTAPLQYSNDGVNFQPSPVLNGLSTGSYTAIVKDANGCTASQPVIVGLTDDLTLSTGNTIIVCEGTGKALPASSNGSSFIWSPATGLANNTQLNTIASPVSTMNYSITAYLGICTKTAAVTVQVNAAPVANAGKDTVLCFGQSVQLQGSGAVQYTWSPATYLDNAATANPTVMQPVKTITYSLQVKDVNDCISLQPATVKVTVTPPAKIFAGNDTAVVMNQAFKLRALDINNSGFVNYTWSPSYGLSNTGIQNPVAVLDREIIYSVTGATAAGCRGTDDIRIKIYKGPEIYVPTAFTPNADGNNDVLKVVTVGIKTFKHFMVFNRWGQQVFTSNDVNKGWDGNYKGNRGDTNVFTWMAEGIDDKGNTIKRKGTVTLIR